MEDGESEGGQRQRFRTRKPRYAGEDLSPTTKWELRGFYAYSAAAEVFAVSGVGSFLPVTLEQLAREKGVLWSDKTTSCVAEKTAKQGAAAIASLLARATDSENHQCVVHVLGAEITTSSFAMYTFSVAVFIQAIALVSFSSIADHGSYRRKLLLGFGFTGAISSMFFLFVVPVIFLVGSVLVIVGVVCLGSSFVILNSFLPLLVANHPPIQRHPDGGESIALESVSTHSQDDITDSSGFRHVHQEFSVKDLPDESKAGISNMISSKGVGIGYVAAVSVQLLSILLLFVLSKTSVSSSLPLRLVLFLVGAWWLTFTIPSFLWLRDRPGPPLKASSTDSSKIHSCFAYVSFAWLSVWQTMKVAIKLRQTIIFLIAWFLLSDAIATVSGTAILFARTELKMETVSIALLSITVTTSGIAGAFIWPMVSRHFDLKSNRTIVACIALMEIIPLYGLLGYVPFIKAWGVGGLQKAWEIYPLGLIHGFVMGGLSSYCRSLFGLLIPPGSEAAFFALYAITDKGSSAIGPAIVGIIVDSTGNIRPAFGFLAVLIALPGPLIWMVDVERGREDAIAMAENMREQISSHNSVDSSGGGRFHEEEGLLEDHD